MHIWRHGKDTHTSARRGSYSWIFISSAMEICEPTTFRGLAFSGKAVKLVEMLVSIVKKRTVKSLLQWCHLADNSEPSRASKTRRAYVFYGIGKVHPGPGNRHSKLQTVVELCNRDVCCRNPNPNTSPNLSWIPLLRCPVFWSHQTSNDARISALDGKIVCRDGP